MALLYANFKETINKLNQELSPKNNKPLKYYLLPKDWLDEYKMKNKYELVASQINFYLMKDYPTFKSLLEDDNTFNANFKSVSLPPLSDVILPPSPNESLKFSNVSNKNLCFLDNFMPVKKEIIEEYSSYNFNFQNKEFFLYDIIIGEGNLFAIDNRNPLTIFICVYDKNQEFFIPKSILSFQNEMGLSEMIKYISENHGINNYYYEKKIFINNENEQEIRDKNGQIIGYFCNFGKSKTNILNNDSVSNSPFMGFQDSTIYYKNLSKNPQISYNIDYSNNYPKESEKEINNQSRNNVNFNNNINEIKYSSNNFNNKNNQDFKLSSNNFNQINNESNNNFKNNNISNFSQARNGSIKNNESNYSQISNENNNNFNNNINNFSKISNESNNIINNNQSNYILFNNENNNSIKNENKNNLSNNNFSKISNKNSYDNLSNNHFENNNSCNLTNQPSVNIYDSNNIINHITNNNCINDDILNEDDKDYFKDKSIEEIFGEDIQTEVMIPNQNFINNLNQGNIPMKNSYKSLKTVKEENEDTSSMLRSQRSKNIPSQNRINNENQQSNNYNNNQNNLRKTFIYNVVGELYRFSFINYNNLKSNIIVSDFDDMDNSQVNYNFNMNNNNINLMLNNKNNNYFNKLGNNINYNNEMSQNNNNFSNEMMCNNRFRNNNNYNNQIRINNNYYNAFENNYNNKNNYNFNNFNNNIQNINNAFYQGEIYNKNNNLYNINNYNNMNTLNNNYNNQNNIINNNEFNKKSYKNNNILISVFQDDEDNNIDKNNNTYNNQIMNCGNQNINNNQNMNYNNNLNNQNIINNKNYKMNTNNFKNVNKYKNINITNSSKKNNIKKSVFQSDEITLTLVSKQLKRYTKGTFPINIKVIKIIEEFKNNQDWLRKFPIGRISIKGNNVDINKTLAEQNIISNAIFEIIFNI